MIFGAKHFELLRFRFHSLVSKIIKFLEFNLDMSGLNSIALHLILNFAVRDNLRLSKLSQLKSFYKIIVARHSESADEMDDFILGQS